MSGLLGLLCRVFLKVSQIDELERVHVSGLKFDRWSDTGLLCFFPALRTEAPAITRIQPGEVHGRPGRHQVIALSGGKFQEFTCDLCADDVHTPVPAAGVTEPVPVKSRFGIVTAGFERLAEHIFSI